MPRPRTIDDDTVLNAVIEIVQRAGPTAVTFTRVAEEVGLSPATLVQRFGTKRGLLLATTIRGWETLVRTLSEARGSHDSSVEALLAALTELTATVRTREAMANGIAFLHIDLSDPEFHAYAVAGANKMLESIEKLLSEAVAAGELVPTDTRRLAAAVQNTYNGALITWAMHAEGTVEGWLRSQVTFLLEGFRPG